MVENLYNCVEEQIRRMKCGQCEVRRDAENGIGEPCTRIAEFVKFGTGCLLDERQSEDPNNGEKV